MTERPILFSAPMVRALLAGTKTQTRRICKGAKLHDSGEDYRDDDGWPLFDASVDGAGDIRIRSPCGVPGDRLWVRETWNPDPPIDNTWASTEWNGCGRSIAGVPERFRHHAFCLYAASWLHGDITWRPSIHMPRWASRITLEVTGVRVERLQDISEADAMAEGARRFHELPYAGDPDNRWSMESPTRTGECLSTPRMAFANLFNKVRGPGSWDANPWVWVVEFRRA